VQDVYTALALHEIRKLEPNGLIFERTIFDAARDAVQAAALEQCFATAKLLAEISLAQREALKAITAASSMAFLTTLAEEKDHVAQLTARNLVSEFGLERLPRIATYLRATSHRVAKLAENPGRDQQAWREYEQGLAVFQASGGEIPVAREAHPLLIEARWLLEELRVSLFAQTLGTAETVSVQRIKKLLSKGST
jgi:ATP-dependent helicase HrpA